MFKHTLHPLHSGRSLLDAIDPRAKILFAATFAIVVALARTMPTMFAGLAVAISLVVVARIKIGDVIRRLLPLEILLILLALVLFWTVPAMERRDGLRLATIAALKANAVLLGSIGLIGTMDAVTLGHALAHLHIPQKLAQLLLFMIRYFDVLNREYARLRAAAKVRGFRPKMNGHTYRTFGHLVGMLLIRGFDRSERTLAAMKCRGFTGKYYMLDHFAFSRRRDVPFCIVAATIVSLLVGIEWMGWL